MPNKSRLDVFEVGEYVDTELYATLDLIGDDPAKKPRYAWRPFEASQGVAIEESGRRATQADTSLHRPAYMGLPQDWQAYVFGWRASVEGAKAIIESDEVAAWAAATVCVFSYREKPYTRLPLSELLRAPAAVLDEDKKKGPPEKAKTLEWMERLSRGYITLPVLLHCNLQFSVDVSTEDSSTLFALRTLLARGERVLKVRIFLRCYLRRPIR